MGYSIKQPEDGSIGFQNEDDGTTAFSLAKTGHPTFEFPSNKAVLFDDFMGDVIADEWSGAAGTDTAAVAPAINVQVNGAARITSGDAGGGDDAADASVLTSSLIWKANQGGLVFEAGLLFPSIASLVVCAGFTDVLATTTVEMPFEIGASQAITSNATDAVCWVFDTGATTDVFYGAGVKNGTDATLVTGIAPAASTLTKLRIEIDSSGNATFIQDGVKRGTQASSVTATTALTPVVAVMTRTTAVKSIDVDYIYVAQDR